VHSCRRERVNLLQGEMEAAGLSSSKEMLRMTCES